MAIALGTALDAVPEALVLGLALRQRVIPVELVIAFPVGNLPEALSGAAGMRNAGRSYRYTFFLWIAIAIGTAVASRTWQILCRYPHRRLLRVPVAFVHRHRRQCST